MPLGFSSKLDVNMYNVFTIFSGSKPLKYAELLQSCTNYWHFYELTAQAQYEGREKVTPQTDSVIRGTQMSYIISDNPLHLLMTFTSPWPQVFFLIVGHTRPTRIDHCVLDMPVWAWRGRGKGQYQTRHVLSLLPAGEHKHKHVKCEI